MFNFGEDQFYQFFFLMNLLLCPVQELLPTSFCENAPMFASRGFMVIFRYVTKLIFVCRVGRRLSFILIFYTLTQFFQ